MCRHPARPAVSRRALHGRGRPTLMTSRRVHERKPVRKNCARSARRPRPPRAQIHEPHACTSAQPRAVAHDDVHKSARDVVHWLAEVAEHLQPRKLLPMRTSSAVSPVEFKALSALSSATIASTQQEEPRPLRHPAMSRPTDHAPADRAAQRRRLGDGERNRDFRRGHPGECRRPLESWDAVTPSDAKRAPHQCSAGR